MSKLLLLGLLLVSCNRPTQVPQCPTYTVKVLCPDGGYTLIWLGNKDETIKVCGGQDED